MKVYAYKKNRWEAYKSNGKSVSVCILSTDGQAALRNKKYVADVSILGSETVGSSALECLRIQIFYLHSPVSML